jgi:hypothetical protein
MRLIGAWLGTILLSLTGLGQQRIKVWDINQRPVLDTVCAELADDRIIAMSKARSASPSKLYLVYRGQNGPTVSDALPYDLIRSHTFQWEKYDGTPEEIDPNCGTYIQRDTLSDGQWSIIGLSDTDGSVRTYASKHVDRGLLNGPYMRAYDGGNVRMTATFRHGVPFGTSRQYFQDGQLRVLIEYSDTCGYWKEHTTWHENGQCASYYSEVMGTLISFYPSGKVLSVAYIARNRTVGVPLDFEEDGTLIPAE